MTRLIIRQGLDLFGGPLKGTEYDLSQACKTCGTGARQTGPLILPRFKPPRFHMFTTLHDEILISPQLVEALASVGIGCTREVLEAKTKEPIPFRQLIPEATLPPYTEETTGYVRECACNVCHRDGYFGIPHVPMVIRYQNLESDLLEKDLLATFERFGNSRLREPFRASTLAAPLYIAGTRFVAVLQNEKIRGIDFEPVYIG